MKKIRIPQTKKDYSSKKIPRNPFGSQRKSGSGYHSEAKYSKRDRRWSEEDESLNQ